MHSYTQPTSQQTQMKGEGESGHYQLLVFIHLINKTSHSKANQFVQHKLSTCTILIEDF